MFHLMIKNYVKENIQVLLVRKNAQSYLWMVPVHGYPCCHLKTLHLGRKELLFYFGNLYSIFWNNAKEFSGGGAFRRDKELDHQLFVL